MNLWRAGRGTDDQQPVTQVCSERLGAGGSGAEAIRASRLPRGSEEEASGITDQGVTLADRQLFAGCSGFGFHVERTVEMLSPGQGYKVTEGLRASGWRRLYVGASHPHC